jgi:hypothetical protein
VGQDGIVSQLLQTVRWTFLDGFQKQQLMITDHDNKDTDFECAWSSSMVTCDAADVQDVLYESQMSPKLKHAGAVNGVILQVHMSSGGLLRMYQEHRTTWCRIAATKRMGIQPVRYQA